MFQPSSLSLSLYHYFHSFYLLPSIYLSIFLSLCFLVPIFLSLCFLVSIFLAIFLHHYCPSFDVFTSYYYYLFFPSFSLLHILFSLIFLFPISFSVSSVQISTSFSTNFPVFSTWDLQFPVSFCTSIYFFLTQPMNVLPCVENF